MCGYHHKNQRGLELKIILSIENDEEPKFISLLQSTFIAGAWGYSLLIAKLTVPLSVSPEKASPYRWNGPAKAA
ncbi:hypothetical protein BGV40_06660 [Methanosarcina sp. Ant1]|nr:hypothetical protein BGV40_06660 [Methanosarcina sp. Ant1]